MGGEDVSWAGFTLIGLVFAALAWLLNLFILYIVIKLAVLNAMREHTMEQERVRHGLHPDPFYVPPAQSQQPAAHGAQPPAAAPPAGYAGAQSLNMPEDFGRPGRR